MAQGVFSLLEVRTEQVKNIANGNFASWSESRSRGYFDGGSSVSVITKVDFSTDVVDRMITGYPEVRYNLATVSSNLYGYSGGGITPSLNYRCAITRVDFANETFSNPGNNFPTSARYNLASVSSSSYGYFSGGNTPTPGATSRIDRLDFTNETISNPTNLITARATHAGFSNDLYGYFAGSAGAPTANIIERLDFSLETTSNPGKNLPYNAADLAATSSSSYGYFAGSSAPGGTALSIIERFDFSNETPSKVNNNLPTTRSNLAAISSDSFGYFGGGTNPTAGPPISLSSVHRFDFNNETIKKLDYDLSNDTTNLSGIYGARSVLRKAGFRTYGYFAGGTDPTPTPGVTSAMSRLDFSTESVSSPNTLPDTMVNMGSIASNNYGYFAYGNVGGGGAKTCRLDFSNDSTLMVTNSISERADSSGFSSNSYGYFGGGDNISSKFNTISRFDFSNETYSNPGKNLSDARNSIATISNSSYGYFGGGDTTGGPGGERSFLSRLDFSNEVVTNLTPLPQERQDFSAGSNYLYGYFFAGQKPGSPPITPDNTSAIMRLDFSNDTASNISPRFPNARQNHTTISADSYSYSGGGQLPPGSLISTITRFNFSTETASNISNTLPQILGVENLGSVTNSN